MSGLGADGLRPVVDRSGNVLQMNGRLVRLSYGKILFMLKTVLRDRGDEVIDLAKVKLFR